MADKHLLREPQHVAGKKGEFWWYEENAGLIIVVPSDCGCGTKQVYISWRRIRGAIKRKDKKNV